jgi:uncharacterized membrane protein YwaF
MDISPEFFPRLLAILFIGTLLLAFALVVRITVKDARRRGKSPVLVTLLVLISFPLGLIVWRLFRPEPIDPQGPPFRLKDYRIQ